ncbi:MAG: DUF2332 domain-containing protein [Polyangiales bacterium]
MTLQAMRDHFREQAGLCEEYGSPFTAELIERMEADLEAGGPVAALVGSWSGPPRVDAVTMRLCGALHAAALSGRDAALRSEYPEQRPGYRMDAVWAAARAFLERDRAWVAEFIRSPPQTNEVRRSIALLPGFLLFAAETDREIDTLEIGASAGLNLEWDTFRYCTAAWEWGARDGVVIDTDWQGPLPRLDARPRIRSRAACDLSPLDVADPAQRLRLRSYIWADQHERLARFDAAADQAVASGVRVERADAAEWLVQRLGRRSEGVATLVYHSVFLQYPPREARRAIIAAIEAAGARATEDAPLGWLRFEPEAMFGGPRESVRFVVDLVTWPGAVRRVLAITDGHARAVHALGPSGGAPAVS